MPKKKDNKKKNIKTSYFHNFLSFFISVAIVINVYTLSFASPEKKRVSKANPFKGNKVTISAEEKNNIIGKLDNSLSVPVTEENVDEYLVLDAILENDDFKEKKEWLCYRLFNLIQENPYLIKEEIYKSLKNVDVTYKKRPALFAENTLGVYYYFLNNINIFSTEEDYETFLHEVIHCIFSSEKIMRLPNFFKEGMVHLLTLEYLYPQPFEIKKSYVFEIAAVKMLCEITSSDLVLKSFTLGDMQYIIDDMVSNGLSKKEAEKAIELLEKALDIYYKKDDSKIDVSNFYKKCIQSLQFCVDKKYGIDDNANLSYYYNELLFYNCLFKKDAGIRYSLDILKYGVDYKAYFCEETKRKVTRGDFENCENNIYNSKLILTN